MFYPTILSTHCHNLRSLTKKPTWVNWAREEDLTSALKVWGSLRTSVKQPRSAKTAKNLWDLTQWQAENWAIWAVVDVAVQWHWQQVSAVFTWKKSIHNKFPGCSRISCLGTNPHQPMQGKPGRVTNLPEIFIFGGSIHASPAHLGSGLELCNACSLSSTSMAVQSWFQCLAPAAGDGGHQPVVGEVLIPSYTPDMLAYNVGIYIYMHYIYIYVYIYVYVCIYMYIYIYG